MLSRIYILLVFCILGSLCNVEATIRPIVMWHGMGDTCCFPFSLGQVKKLLESQLDNVYVKSLKIGESIVIDYQSGFFVHPDDQIDYVCKELAKDKRLAEGYNAIGFSQGGQFLRAVAQRCPYPPMKVLISLGGQHQGIFGLPSCPSLSSKTCEYLRKFLNKASYTEWAQKHLVQATYWHDPLNDSEYRSKSTFLSDINNELILNKQYADNLNKLEKFVLVKFLNDSVVQPRESEWFEFYKPGQDTEILPLKQSKAYERTGLLQMDKDNKLVFLAPEGDHLQMSHEWICEKLIPFLK